MISNNNNNKRKSALSCLLACVTLAKLIPVVFVLAVLAWSYYAYVVELCFCKSTTPYFLTSKSNPSLIITVNVEEWPKRLIYLVIYHILFVLLTWSYLGAVMTKNKRPPAEVSLLKDINHQIH